MSRFLDQMPIMGQVGQSAFKDDGNFIELAASRQGALVTIDQLLQWAIEGRTFHAQQGDAATQLDFAEVAYDEDQPQFALRVPTGRAVIPLSLVVSLEDRAGTDTLITWSTTTNDIGNGTSTDLTISSMRLDAPFSSGCVARSLYTANATAATGLIEFERFVEPFAAAQGVARMRYSWNIRSAAAVPVLIGPATLQMHVVATTTAPQGFGEYVWAEFETPLLVKKAS